MLYNVLVLAKFDYCSHAKYESVTYGQAAEATKQES